jgi:hypothetical protein
MKVCVFVGPSISLTEARAILPEAHFRPPAAQGDLLSCLRQDQPEVIGLIDGTFHQNLSVWHTEICYVLNQGVAVYGSSSMGAIRAVETEPFGMIGIGRVFEWYRDGLITADDEVALLHGLEDTGFCPLSVPLVNIRASLQQAVAQGWIDTEVRDYVTSVAQAIHYPQRQIAAILEKCDHTCITQEAFESVHRALTIGYVDVKREDARRLLRTIQKYRSAPPLSPPVPFQFNHSGGFDGLYNIDRRVKRGDIEIPLQSIAEHVALYSPEFEELRASSLHQAICLFFAGLVEVSLTDQDVENARVRFLRDRALDTPDAIHDWLQQNDLSHSDFKDFIRQEAICAGLRRWILEIGQFDRGAKYLLDELRRRGIYSLWADRAAEETALADSYCELPEYASVRSQDPALLAQQHGQSTGVCITGDAAAWGEERGFENIVGLESALRRASVCQDVRNRIARVRGHFDHVVQDPTGGHVEDDGVIG